MTILTSFGFITLLLFVPVVEPFYCFTPPQIRTFFRQQYYPLHADRELSSRSSRSVRVVRASPTSTAESASSASSSLPKKKILIKRRTSSSVVVDDDHSSDNMVSNKKDRVNSVTEITVHQQSSVQQHNRIEPKNPFQESSMTTTTIPSKGKKLTSSKKESPRELAAMLMNTMTTSEKEMFQTMVHCSDEEILSTTQSTILNDIDIDMLDGEDNEEEDEEDTYEDSDFDTEEEEEDDDDHSSATPTNMDKGKRKHQTPSSPKQLADLLKETMTEQEKAALNQVMHSNKGKNNQNEIIKNDVAERQEIDENTLRTLLGADGLRKLHAQGVSIREALRQYKKVLDRIDEAEIPNLYQDRGYGTKKRYKNAQERKQALATEREMKQILHDQREALASGANLDTIKPSSQKHANRRKVPSLNEVMESIVTSTSLSKDDNAENGQEDDMSEETSFDIDKNSIVKVLGNVADIDDDEILENEYN